ncbi:MAG: MCE family protein [Candidatus Sumerlaeia bacterium]|nr:MCE family protein [Candidatus Sumerlaeia bacterium]
MNSSRKTELIVGLFVLFSFITLMVMSFLIKGGTGPGSYQFQMEFEDVSGLDIGSPVLVSGFRTGQVVSMRSAFDEEDQHPIVMVTARVSRTIPIYRDAHAVMNQQGFIGDKQLEINPGTPSAGEISRNEIISASPFSALAQFLPGGEEAFDDVQGILRNIRAITEDRERLDNIDRVIANLAEMTEELTSMVEENRETFRLALDNIEKVSARSIKVAENAEKVLQRTDQKMDQIGSEVQTLLADFGRTNTLLLERIESISNKADSIGVNAEGLLMESREELERISGNFVATSDKINRLLDEINTGEGTAGMLLRDPQPFNDLKDSMAALRHVLLQERDAFYDRSLPYRDGGRESTP